MHTNLEINEKLIKNAFKCAPKSIKTKRDLVDLALHEFIRNHSLKKIRELYGKIHFRKNYNYKELRYEVQLIA